MADWARFVVLSGASANYPALMEALVVGRAWLAETTDEAGRVRVSVWSLLFGADPWKGSRTAYQALAAKWQGRI